MKSAGQNAFEAYNESKGGKTWDGKPIPPWSEVGGEVQAGWAAAANAAIEHHINHSVKAVSDDPQTLREWQEAIHTYACDKGWWDNDERTFGDLCTLFTSEISEAYEEYRNGHEVTETYFNEDKPGKPEGVPTELADCVIRILDYCQRVGIDLQAIMARKHAYNQKRPYRHGNKRT
tara:strand:- start:865 stop:1392 length:528 start_codon:yes stop_codon:yes gene_type:complete